LETYWKAFIRSSGDTGIHIKIDFKEIYSEVFRWIELAQDHVQWRVLVLAVLNLRVLLPESELVRWILGKWAVRMGGGWDWLRIVSNGGLWY
jgi:hypothetical protein